MITFYFASRASECSIFYLQENSLKRWVKALMMYTLRRLLLFKNQVSLFSFFVLLYSLVQLKLQMLNFPICRWNFLFELAIDLCSWCTISNSLSECLFHYYIIYGTSTVEQLGISVSRKLLLRVICIPLMCYHYQTHLCYCVTEHLYTIKCIYNFCLLYTSRCV